jgi:hypothetical protein
MRGSPGMASKQQNGEEKENQNRQLGWLRAGNDGHHNLRVKMAKSPNTLQ